MNICVLLVFILLSGCVYHLPDEAYQDMQSTLVEKPNLYYVNGNDGTDDILYKLQSCNANLVNEWNDKATARNKITNYSKSN